jgi:K+-sensing histidine kinase KdpD
VFASQTALVVGAPDCRVAEQARVQAETERLRSTLLVRCRMTCARRWRPSPARQQLAGRRPRSTRRARELAQSITTADRLNRLVRNLLDMTKLNRAQQVGKRVAASEVKGRDAFSQQRDRP